MPSEPKTKKSATNKDKKLEKVPETKKKPIKPKISSSEDNKRQVPITWKTVFDHFQDTR